MIKKNSLKLKKYFIFKISGHKFSNHLTLPLFIIFKNTSKGGDGVILLSEDEVC